MHPYKHYIKAALALFFSNTCVLCRKELTLRENHICSQCAADIVHLPKPQCTRCARPITRGSEKGKCPNCYNRKFYYRKIFCFLALTPTTHAVFHHVKYYQKPWLLDILFENLPLYIQTVFPKNRYNGIIAIPLSWTRRMLRGFNQSYNIAKQISIQTHIPIIKHSLKRRNTISQSKLKRKERLTKHTVNFMIRQTSAIKNKHILLIDDIYTTGSTVNACAKILRENGAQSVDVFTLARTI